jgi:hypothetical protein
MPQLRVASFLRKSMELALTPAKHQQRGKDDVPRFSFALCLFSRVSTRFS